MAAAVTASLSLLLARPTTAVSQAAARLARGDLTSRAPVLRGDREVGGLTRTFDDMAGSLEALERERQQAVADIALEPRTPIAVMQARLDALEDGVYSLDTAAQIALLGGQTQLPTRLVGDLGDRAAGRGVRPTLHADPAPVTADRDRLRQVIVNLVENALRHARAEVALRVEVGADEVRLHADDDGPGIPEGGREAVFTRFTRLDESRSRDTGGSGLGLAIAGAHGGQAVVGTSP